MPEEITLKKYTTRYITHCENKNIDFNEAMYYNLVKLKYGNEAVISAKMLVQKYFNEWPFSAW